MFDTGDGGTIMTDDPSLADTLRILETQIPAGLREVADLLRDTKICITGSLVWVHQTIDF